MNAGRTSSSRRVRDQRSRREFLKLGLVGGAGAWLASGPGAARAAATQRDPRMPPALRHHHDLAFLSLAEASELVRKRACPYRAKFQP
jgi:hypothetical protein